jgi:hypothetical protein
LASREFALNVTRSIHYFEPGTDVKVRLAAALPRMSASPLRPRCTTSASLAISSSACDVCATSKFCSLTPAAGHLLPSIYPKPSLPARARANSPRRVLANYAWKMLVFSDAAKRWQVTCYV